MGPTYFLPVQCTLSDSHGEGFALIRETKEQFHCGIGIAFPFLGANILQALTAFSCGGVANESDRVIAAICLPFRFDQIRKTTGVEILPLPICPQTLSLCGRQETQSSAC